MFTNGFSASQCAALFWLWQREHFVRSVESYRWVLCLPPTVAVDFDDGSVTVAKVNIKFATMIGHASIDGDFVAFFQCERNKIGYGVFHPLRFCNAMVQG